MDQVFFKFDTDGFDVDEVIANNRITLNTQIVKAIAENPLVNIQTTPIGDATLDDYKNYLRQMHTTLWGSFSIGSEKGLDKAAKWLQREVDSFFEFFSNTKS